MRRVVAAVLLAVVLAVLAGMPSSAWAAPAWLVQPDLSATGENASVPDVAMSFSGDVIVAWQGSPNGGPVQVVQRAAGAAFSAPLQFGMASFDWLGTPQAAINDDGDAVVVWQEAGGDALKFSVWGASRLAGGSFGAPVRVSGAGTSAVDPQVAINAAGDIVVAWGGREETR